MKGNNIIKENNLMKRNINDKRNINVKEGESILLGRISSAHKTFATEKTMWKFANNFYRKVNHFFGGKGFLNFYWEKIVRSKFF
jgi:hypothetical protein